MSKVNWTRARVTVESLRKELEISLKKIESEDRDSRRPSVFDRSKKTCCG